jgi:hypothetical protein
MKARKNECDKGKQPDLLSQAMVQLEPEIRRALEYYYLEGHSLKKSYELAGIGHKFNKGNAYVSKGSKFSKVYIEHLVDRQLVISEFGVDEPKAVELVKMRDAAFRAGDIVPALRAHELILKLVSRLGPVGGDRDNGSKRKEASQMTREEIIARLDEIQMAVTGEPADIPGRSVDSQLEVMRGES